MTFNPLTDHVVEAFMVNLPEPGTRFEHTVHGRQVSELVMKSWWTDMPLRDPALHGRRHAAMITRTVD